MAADKEEAMPSGQTVDGDGFVSHGNGFTDSTAQACSSNAQAMLLLGD